MPLFVPVPVFLTVKLPPAEEELSVSNPTRVLVTITAAVPPVLAERLEVLTVAVMAPVALERLTVLAVSKLLPGDGEPEPPALKVMEFAAVMGLLTVILPAVEPTVLKVRLLTAVKVCRPSMMDPPRLLTVMFPLRPPPA